jgi:hypothetical protein
MANPCEEIDTAKQSETFLRDLSTGAALLQRKVICWSEITKGSRLLPGSPPTRQTIRLLIVNTGPSLNEA